jgi:hypothetical protein
MPDVCSEIHPQLSIGEETPGSACIWATGLTEKKSALNLVDVWLPTAVQESRLMRV